MFLKNHLSRLLALVLVVVIGLMGCSPSASGLTGNFQQDTVYVVETLTKAIDLPDDAADKAEIQDLAHKQIYDYAARYRRDDNVSGLRSFTTMQTALNALAGYYSSYGNRPLPDKLKERLHKEFDDVLLSVKRNM